MANKNNAYWPRDGLAVANVRPLEAGQTVVELDQAAVEAINQHLALYRQTGNPLFAWAALTAWQEATKLLPEGLADYFMKVADDLIFYADSEPDERAATRVYDAVIGREAAPRLGRSVFQEYRTTRLHKDVHEAVCAELAGGLEGGPAGPVRRREDLFEMVGSRFKLDPERVRTIFQLAERSAGSFGFKAVRAAQKSLSEGGGSPPGSGTVDLT